MSRHEHLEPAADPLMPIGGEIDRHADGNPFRKMHTLLNGRYHWAILLATVIGVGAAVGGFFLQKPMYQATGMVRVNAYIGKVLYNSDDTGVLPMFDAFAAWQTELLRTPRVLEMALADDAWKNVQDRLPEDFRETFPEELIVSRGERSGLIGVSFKSPDPDVARLAVKSVVEAYMRSYGENDVERETQRLKILQERRDVLSSELSSLRSRILSLANEYGSDNLEQIYQFRLEQMQKLEQAFKETELALASTGGAEDVEIADRLAQTQADAASNRSEVVPPPTTDNVPSDATPGNLTLDNIEAMTIEQIAVVDAPMRSLIDQRFALRTQLLDLTERHPDRVDIQKAIGQLDEVIAERADAYKAIRTSTELVRHQQAVSPAERVAQLERRVARLRNLYEEARAATVALGRKKLQIDSLKADAEIVRQRLDETKFRMEELNVESNFGGRVEIVTTGTTPTLPYNDSKRQQIAVVAGVGGAGMGVGLIMLIGLLDPRMRTSADTFLTDHRVRLLGMLPRLPDNLADPEQAANAAFCVHHIRSMLQIGVARKKRKVLTVTSPAPGTGKSSLTLSLGLSFATARSRTLLIDADFCGRGLTRRLEGINRTKIGQVLVEQNLITEEQLAEATQAAVESGRQLCQSLIDLGFMSEADLDKAISVKEISEWGLLAAIDGVPLHDCVAETGIPNVWLLPAGNTTAHDMNSISPDRMHAVVDQLREQFDVILIDTGPLPGDVGASIVATESDGVILVVSRGEHRYLAEHAIEMLRTLGVRLEGLVFNRAEPRDIRHSAVSGLSSLSADAATADSVFTYGDISDSPAGKRSAHFGPVAKAVACTAIVRRSSVNGRAPAGHA